MENKKEKNSSLQLPSLADKKRTSSVVGSERLSDQLNSSVRIGDEEDDDDVKEWEKDPLLEKCVKISEGIANALEEKASHADKLFERFLRRNQRNTNRQSKSLARNDSSMIGAA